ncbi:MAG: B12-binding domain-containing radical SAM protein [Magnetococcales bacterium]|nr:B12-binding domain-containing radical SAM protein [Magnetococcales bacterium]
MAYRVLLIRPNHSNGKKNPYGTFPLGLAYIAAVLRESGHEVQIMDLSKENVDMESVAQSIERFNPDMFGLTAISFEYVFVKKLASWLKEKYAKPIILGGQLASHSPTLVVENSDVDICVIGEGELTIVDLLNNMDKLGQVKGIVYRDGEVTRSTSPRELIQDLDSVPFPAYDLVDMDEYSEFLKTDIYMSPKYLPKLPKGQEHRVMAVMSGRGCPFVCGYCTQMFESIRKRSIENVMEEMTLLKEKYGITIINFVDELFFFSKKYTREFCEKVAPMKMGWYGNARIDTVDKELLTLISKSGCLTIGYGVETASAEILKRMHKKITPKRIERTMRETLEVGLPTSIGLILGYPGETRETVQETIDMLKRVGFPGTKFHYVTPYPGSPLYNECVANGTISDELSYLESLGDGTGPYKFRFNFTDMSDQELSDLLHESSRKVMRNYLWYLVTHPKYLFRYLRYKDFMNPVYYYYSQWRRPTNYSRAAKATALTKAATTNISSQSSPKHAPDMGS